MTAFRTNPAGRTRPAAPSSAQAPASPFSQVQILHLMKTEFARARRYAFPVSCVLLQIDRFRALLDVHGVALGDAVRGELARLVAERTRGSDHLGLLTEDRYLLLLPHAAEEQAVQVAERVARQFAELEITAGGAVLALSLSLGIAGCSDQDTLFFDTMLSRAEAALEWAVEAGGGRAEVFRKDRFLAP